MNIEVKTVLEAVEFSREAHNGQVRKFGGEDYFWHPFRVASRVAQTDGATTDMIVAALLHDVLEDCPQVKPTDIGDQFGYHVFNLVYQLTDPPVVPGGPNRATRKQATRRRLHLAGPEVQTIKCADLIDNIPSIVEHDKNFAPRFIQEARGLYYVLGHADATIHDELHGMLEWAEKELDKRESDKRESLAEAQFNNLSKNHA